MQQENGLSHVETKIYSILDAPSAKRPEGAAGQATSGKKWSCSLFEQ